MATLNKYPFQQLPSGRYRRYLELKDVIKLASIPVSEDLPEWSDIGKPRSQDYHKPPEQSWDLGCGYQNALKMLKVGWPEKVKELTNQAKVISVISARPNIEYSHEIAGDEVDVSRFLAGEPECFLEGKLTDKDSENPVVSLYISITTTDWISAQTHARRGTAAFAIVQALESLGRAVEINLCISSQSNIIITEYIKIKEAHEYLNPSRLAFMLIHPAMCRRIEFRMEEQYPTELQIGLGIRNRGYGQPAYLFQDDMNKDAIVFNSLIDNEDAAPFASDKSAGEHIRKILETKGISFA